MKVNLVTSENCGCETHNNPRRGITSFVTCPHHREEEKRYLGKSSWEDKSDETTEND